MRARADQVKVQLRYERAPGAEVCLDEPTLRDAVAARLGYDPFAAGELADIVEVAVAPRSRGFEARIVRRKPDRAEPSKPSRIRTQGTDCRELTSALALAVSVVIDPLSIARPPSAETPESPPVPERVAAEQPSRATEEVDADGEADDALPPDLEARARLAAADAQRAPTQFHVGLGPTLGARVLPRLSFGGQLLLGLSHEWFELDVDARYEAAGAHERASASQRSSLLAASLAPCARYGWVRACVSGSVGSLRSERVRLSVRDSERDLYAALGVRSALEIPLSRLFALRLHGAWVYSLGEPQLFGWRVPSSGFLGGILFMASVP